MDSAERPWLQVVVTTCCGRNLGWLGNLFSATNGWHSQLALEGAEQSIISLAGMLGSEAHLLVYDKGGNASTARIMRQQLRDGGMTHMANLQIIPTFNSNGREAHTIAHHVAENHDQLAPLTTFIQGDAKSNHMLALVHLHAALLTASAQVEQQAAVTAGPRVRRGRAGAILDVVRRRMNAAAPLTSDSSLCPVTIVPPLLCEAGPRSPDFREWPCPPDFSERQGRSKRPLHHLGGYTSLAGFVMAHFLQEHTWPGMEVPYCHAGSLSATAEQLRRHKSAEWWRALRQLVTEDRKIKWVSALRMAHVLERLWLRIFSGPLAHTGASWPRLPATATDAQRLLALPQCFRNASSTCCVGPRDCCCPTLPRSPAAGSAEINRRRRAMELNL